MYALNREECQEINRAWEDVEAMLQNKIATLEVALEVAKDEVSRAFADDFDSAIEQIKVVQPNIDTSPLDPFKSVVDGQIVDEYQGSKTATFLYFDKL